MLWDYSHNKQTLWLTLQRYSLIFICKSFSKGLLMLILLHILFFMLAGTLFSYRTLIFVQFLLSLRMIFLFFFNPRVAIFLILIVSLCHSYRRNEDNATVLFCYHGNNQDSSHELFVVHIEVPKVWSCKIWVLSVLWFLNYT